MSAEFWFDEEAAQRAVDFFARWLRHQKGELAGQPMELSEWQAERIIRPLFGWKRANGTRKYRTAYVEIPRKNGKALALDTPLPTPDGWTTMGAVRLGDVLFDERGWVCVVTFATEAQHGRECFRVGFSDDTAIVADADHLWMVYDRYRDRELLRTTREISLDWQIGNRGLSERRYSMPTAGPLQPPDVELPVPPYVLGVWLGDGDSAAAAVTCSEKDSSVMAEVAAQGVSVRRKRASGAPRYTIGSGGRSQYARDRSLQAVLRSMGLLNNKHIPSAYLRAAARARMALMRGLMDTDGYVSKAGQCEFTTTRPALRDGFMELARSLGFKPSLKTARATIYGRDVGEKYRVQFWAWADDPVFTLRRKCARLKPRPRGRVRSMTRQIVAVEPVSSVPVRCIQVSSPSGLFLAGGGMVPTHNTTIAAGVGLYLLFSDGEHGAEIYSAAVDREQAAIAFDLAKSMVEAEPALRRRAQVFRRSIVVPATGSSYKVISADARSKHGFNAHGIIFDEIHAQPNRDLYDVLHTSTGARRQPIEFLITTAGVYEPESIAWQLHAYAERVLDGSVDDPSFLAVIYGAPKEADYRDPAVHAASNPGIGISVKADYLLAESKRAEEEPSYENTFRRLHLNQWTEQVTRWLKKEEWEACAGTLPDLAGRFCFPAMDLSTTTDISAVVLTFPPLLETDPFILLPFFWCPQDTVMKASRADRVPYDAWVRDGYMEATPGNVVDYRHIRARIVALSRLYQFGAFPFDPWNATQLAGQLQDEDGFQMVEHRQGFISMNEPSKEFERLVISRRLLHPSNPVLNWMVSNVSIRRDPAGNIKPDKERSTGRIDGLVAGVMGVGVATRMVQHEPALFFLGAGA